MSRAWWDVLGVDPSADERTIRRAYSTLLKSTSPEDDAAGFMELRAAYEQGRALLAYQARYPEAFTDLDEDEPDPVDGGPHQQRRAGGDNDHGLEESAPPEPQFIERRRSLVGADQPDLANGPFFFEDGLPRPEPTPGEMRTAPQPIPDDPDSDANLAILLEQLDRIERSLYEPAGRSVWSTTGQMLEILLNDPLLERLDLRSLVEHELGRMVERNWPRSKVIGERCAVYFGWETADLRDYRPNVPELYQAQQELNELLQRALHPVHELAGILKFMRKEPNPGHFFWVLQAIWWSNAAARVLYLDAPGMEDVRRFIPSSHRAVWHRHGAGWRRIRLGVTLVGLVLIGLLAVFAAMTPRP